MPARSRTASLHTRSGPTAAVGRLYQASPDNCLLAMLQAQTPVPAHPWGGGLGGGALMKRREAPSGAAAMRAADGHDVDTA
jgi:hypothetical protein